MTVAVKPIETGSPIGSGPYLPPVVGGVGLWDHVWGAPTLRGVVAPGGPVASMPDALGTAGMTGTGGVFRDGTDPFVEFAPTSTVSAMNLEATRPAAAEWTQMVILEADKYVNNAVRGPNYSANFAGTWAIFSTANTTTTAPAALSTKTVTIFRRKGATLSIWVNGALGWSGDIAWNALASVPVGVKPTRAGVDAVLKFYEMRFAARALSDAEITAVTADARALHGI